MQLQFVAGTNFQPTTDSAGTQIVVNETAVKALGFESPRQLVGQVLIQPWNSEALEVVGIVRDFWLKLPIVGDRIEPAFLRNDPRRFSYANVKIVSGNLPETMAALERQWKRIDPIHPFKYEFYEDELASTHAGIFDVAAIFGFLAFIAITIACLGMLGMATYTAERKKKEVGIRKVLGAEVSAIVLMLSRDFLKIILIAICIGAPMSWFLNNLWLQTFVTRAHFGFGTVLLGTTVLLVLGMLTIASQTIRVSKSNPVDTLKME